MNGYYLRLFEKKVKENLEALNQQIINLTLLLNQLIHDNLAKTAPTANCRIHRPQTGPSFDGETGASRTLPDIHFVAIFD